jgi:hypothetical protein
MGYSIVEEFKGINFIPPCVKISLVVEKDTMGPCEQTQSHAPCDLTHFLFPFKQVKSIKCLFVTLKN